MISIIPVLLGYRTMIVRVSVETRLSSAPPAVIATNV
jgi:hypothetical protein